MTESLDNRLFSRSKMARAVAILIHMSIPFTLIHHWSRVCIIHLTHSDMHVACVYGSSLAPEREDIWDNQITPLLTPQFANTVFGGDFNGTRYHHMDATTTTNNDWHHYEAVRRCWWWNLGFQEESQSQHGARPCGAAPVLNG